MTRTSVWTVGLVFLSGCLITASLLISGCSQGGGNGTTAAHAAPPPGAGPNVDATSINQPTHGLSDNDSTSELVFASFASKGSYVVPAGKRLVIDVISTQVPQTAGAGVVIQILNPQTQVQSGFFIPLQNINNQSTAWGGSLALHLVIPPGFRISHFCFPDNCAATTTLFGHLVPQL